MEIGKQIKKYRSEMGVSQEELAERIFVSRQTISNWENDKNYPDLKSLLLLSSLFCVSLDILVKGDIEQMKEEIKSEDIKYVKRIYRIHNILTLSSMLLSLLVVILFGLIPRLMFEYLIITLIIAGILCLLSAAGLLFTYRVLKLRKDFDIKSFKEVIAFCEGKPLSEIDKQRAREEPCPYKKREYAIVAIYYVLMLISVVFVYFRLFV